MKYFLSLSECKAAKSSCFHEFYAGDWNEGKHTFWNRDSMYLHDDLMYVLRLDSLLCEVISAYDPFGETRVSREQWTMIVNKARIIGGTLCNLIFKITPWVDDVLSENNVFTILGL